VEGRQKQGRLKTRKEGGRKVDVSKKVRRGKPCFEEQRPIGKGCLAS